MCDRVVSEDAYFIVNCPNRYKTQRMFDEAGDDCAAASKFIPDWFVTSKILENFDKALQANDDTFFANQRHILAIDLDNDNNLMKILLLLLFMSDFWLGIVNLKNPKHSKEDKWRIDASSLASQKMVEFLHFTMRKRNRTNFYWQCF